eukprot:TRINITY_DN13949_c0_g1_i2.p1 TRINITY_DN13949_c0_g1~~TRINITY_DN13949_c0_g1_i2.p1  ORF type:complete len:826 (+),score=231.88 TRINITY_DN13949_c0_g1_i2:126-2603(+)
MSSPAITELAVRGAFLIQEEIHYDNRGYFRELYRENKVANFHPDSTKWRQVAISESAPDVIRGLHCSPYPKLCTVTKGRLYEVIVDLRPDSETFLKWIGVWLEVGDSKQLLIPAGCAHGFYSATESHLTYLQGGVYEKSNEVEIHWNDPALGIDWPKPKEAYIISEKDKTNPLLETIRPLLNLRSSTSTYQHDFMVLGANGYFGSHIVKCMQEKGKRIAISEARCENRTQVLEDIQKYRPKHIFCAAGISGRPNIDWCEDHPQETLRANVLGMLTVVDCAAQNGIGVTLFGSGSLYKADDKHPVGSGHGFKEVEEPNNLGKVYLRLRAQLEDMLKLYDNVLNLRVIYPISSDIHERSVVSKLLKYDKVASTATNWSVLDSLFPIAVDMAERDITGTFNFVNPGTMTHNEVLELYKKYVDPEAEWVNMDASAGRAAAELDTSKLRAIYPNIPDIRTAVEECFKKTAAARSLHAVPTLDNEYSPVNILLTGGAGFIGSGVCNYLVNKYPSYRIVCLDVMDYCASERNLEGSIGKSNFTLIKGDIQNYQLVKHVMTTYQVDTIMHFAAQSHVDLSFGNSLEFTKTNVFGTHVLLECARELGIKRFVHVSTDEVYGEVTGSALAGEHNFMLEPTNPYSCSKAAAEFITKAYVRSFNLPVIISRGNNVYGPRQFPEKVIPKFILRLLRGEKCCIHGKGEAKRTYVHVDDVADAFDRILHKGKVNDIYNIGTADEVDMLTLARLLVRLIKGVKPGEEDMWIEFIEDRKFNDCRYGVDHSRLEGIGWKPSVHFEEGIRRTIDWYRSLDPKYWEEFEYSLAGHPTVKLHSSTS